MRTLALITAASLASIANADIVYTAGGTLSMPFVIGSGISNTDFYIGSGSGIEVGLRARGRWNGEVSYDGNDYFVQSGFSATSGSDPTPSPYAWWNIDLSISGGGVGIATHGILLQIDFDPAEATTGFVNVLMNLVPGVPPTGPYQASENLAFDYWAQAGAPPFNPNALGTYEIRATVYSLADGSVFSNSDIMVHVIPAPGALALVGLAGLATRRRRN